MMGEQIFLKEMSFMPEFNPAHEKFLSDAMKNVKNAKADKMFGFPVYKANDTMAVSVKSDGIIAKVGEAKAKELIGKKGIKAYEPQPGRVWKDWVLVTDNFDSHKEVFAEAIKYVGKGK